MEWFDTILRGVILPDGRQVDIAVNGGIIAHVGKLPGGKARYDYDYAGLLVTPGFIDIHTHLEKAMTAHLIPNESGTLGEAIRNFGVFFQNVTEEAFYQRGREAMRMALSNGTTVIRSHITLDSAVKLRAIRAMKRLQQDFAGKVDLEIIAFLSPYEQQPDGRAALVSQAMQAGATVLGGCPTLEKDTQGFLDFVFAQARQFDVDIDLHVDESDEPSADVLRMVAEKTIAEQYEGRVTAGHCCSLSAVDEEEAARVIERVARAGLSVVTLPSCNLFLMGRGDRGLVRRGITRVRQLHDAGVNVCVASDNIRDPFRPFGNADMLEELLLLAQLTRMATDAELLEIFQMGTYHPARAMRRKDYGLDVRCRADLVVLDAPSVPEALRSGAAKRAVFKDGRLVFRQECRTDWLDD